MILGLVKFSLLLHHCEMALIERLLFIHLAKSAMIGWGGGGEGGGQSSIWEYRNIEKYVAKTTHSANFFY